MLSFNLIVIKHATDYLNFFIPMTKWDVLCIAYVIIGIELLSNGPDQRMIRRSIHQCVDNDYRRFTKIITPPPKNIFKKINK